MLSPGFRKFEIASWIIICVLGTIGNVLVVLVVYRKRKMKTVTNHLIVNLAFADLAVLLINVPLDVAHYFNDSAWLYGGFMCHIIRPLQTMATTASVWSLVAISISRYVAIVHPLKPQLRRTHARLMILPVWAISLVLVSPYMASLDIKDGECVEDFQSAGMDPKYYTIGIFITQYVVPLAIIAFSYIRVGRELTKNPNHDERTRSHYKETRKVLKMLIVVVVVFAILVLPLHIVQIWYDFFDGASSKYNEEISSIAITMLYGNSFTNPIIYNACNEEFRKSFRSYFRILIKPCARLVLGDRLDWDNRPEIFDDLGTTFNRTRSFRRSSSRRETLVNIITRTNGEIPNRRQDNNNNNRISRRISFANDVDNAIRNHQTCTNHTDWTNHRRSVPYSKASLVQYVSVL
ncbi:neuropeptide FF receptor 2-like [Paramuricea clavata]|uniref:Neuropeptide FF receptor 2-like n=1 Tax=Paramuricea clavata TaxID=317549 RepID=A0A7D9HYZ8_PARCT|nr:neuropeptide FF receptor 2-like [Paramuricea clavata]